MHISHLLLQLLIEPTIRFFVDGNDEGGKISFKFLRLFYIALIDFSGKNIFILGSLYNKGNLFLINLLKSGSKRLNSVKNEVTLKSILNLGCRTFSLEILAALENCLLTLCGLYPLAIKYCWYSLLLILNLLSVSQIRLNLKATPCGTFSIFFLGKHVEGIT